MADYFFPVWQIDPGSAASRSFRPLLTVQLTCALAQTRAAPHADRCPVSGPPPRWHGAAPELSDALPTNMCKLQH